MPGLTALYRASLGLLFVVSAGVLLAPAAHASPGSPAEDVALTRLFGQVAKVMSKLEAPLDIPQSEWLELVSHAEELIDPRTHRFYRTRGGRPLPYYVFEPEASCQPEAVRTVFFLGGIHSDEIAPMYSSFEALAALMNDPRRHQWNTRVIYVPLANPDGLIGGFNNHHRPTRENGLGVDLNRNFEAPNPQNETRFLKQLLDLYHPQQIIALHGPYGWLDYDGPAKGPYASPEVRQGVQEWLDDVSHAGHPALPINQDFTIYHGSMGDYGGNRLRAHVLTLEYPTKDPRRALENWNDYNAALFESLVPIETEGRAAPAQRSAVTPRP